MQQADLSSGPHRHSLQPEHLLRRVDGEHRQRPARKLLLAACFHPVQPPVAESPNLAVSRLIRGCRAFWQPSSRPVQRPQRRKTVTGVTASTLQSKKQ